MNPNVYEVLPLFYTQAGVSTSCLATEGGIAMLTICGCEMGR